MLVDAGSPVAVVTHHGHQVAQPGAACRGPVVSGVRRSWKCRPLVPIVATASSTPTGDLDIGAAGGNEKRGADAPQLMCGVADDAVRIAAV